MKKYFLSILVVLMTSLAFESSATELVDCGKKGSVTERLIDCKLKNPLVFDRGWSHGDRALLVSFIKKFDLQVFAFFDRTEVRLAAFSSKILNYTDAQNHPESIAKILELPNIHFGFIGKDAISYSGRWDRDRSSLIYDWMHSVETRNFWVGYGSDIYGFVDQEGRVINFPGGYANGESGYRYYSGYASSHAYAICISDPVDAELKK